MGLSGSDETPAPCWRRKIDFAFLGETIPMQKPTSPPTVRQPSRHRSPPMPVVKCTGFARACISAAVIKRKVRE